ncbi:ADORA2B [Mytilus coruscus]|uniref:ADORA2B n=1 Tax=Mytilus coruscus TaxID=42192 RepID=A0A6J8AZ20_MYTCO|nr:ADORA2B [Mytilus coruscus]
MNFTSIGNNSWSSSDNISTDYHVTLTQGDILFFIYYYGIFGLLTCINIPGNLIVVLTVVKHHQLRQPCNYYIASLAVSDFLIGIVYPIYNISHLEKVREVSEKLGNWSVCRVIVCEVLALEIGSSYHLVAITVTRYIAIVYPLRYHIYVTTKTTTIAIAVIWILSQGSSLIMYTMYEPDRPVKLCRYEMIFPVTHVIILLVIQLFIPLAVMLGLYVKIARIARQQAKVIAIQQACIMGNVGTKNGIIKNELKSTVMVSLLLGCFTLSWTPMIIFFFYTITCSNPPCTTNRYVRATVRILLYLNSSVNVFIYAGRLTEFRKRIKSDMSRCFYTCFPIWKVKPRKKTSTQMNLVSSSLSRITLNGAIDATLEIEQVS